MQNTDIFTGKRVTVMGLGLLGRGVGDAKYIAEAGAAEVVVTDLKTEAELQSSVTELAGYENVRFVLGEHREADFTDTDMVLVAAGVPLDSKYLAAARAAGVPLKQSAALFAEIAQIPIIGVTGTRGKSTVTHMIHHALETITGETVLLGGNIRGVSSLQLLHDVHADSVCVMELDSWQLQGWGWAGISPHIAVFTNFMDDHANYYGGDMQAYFADKAQIFLHQDETGVLITTPEVFRLAQEMAATSGAKLGQEVVLADASIIPEEMLLAMPGEHNRQNAVLAYEALKAVSLTDEEIFPALASFAGVPGRLQYVTTVDNIRIYNDNNATTPEATTAGLEALDVGNQNIILICGGADKQLDLTALHEAITAHAKHVVLLPGTGTDLLQKQWPNAGTSYEAVTTLEDALYAAKAASENGDIILFSPAFASFGQFQNEYERNDAFLALVDQLTPQSEVADAETLLHKADTSTS